MHLTPAPPRILLVDDDSTICETVSSLLLMPVRPTPEDLPRPIASHVTVAHSMRHALSLIDAHGNTRFTGEQFPHQNFPFDIVLADLNLGSIHANETGLHLLREIRGRGTLVGLVLVTGSANSDVFINAIRSGVDDMLLKPVSLASLRDSIHRTYARLEENRSQISQIHRFTTDLLQLRTKLADSTVNFSRVERTVVEALLEALEIRQPGAYQNALRTQAYTIYFAQAINYPESLLPQLERASILHDIGKIGLADQLLFTTNVFSSADHERAQQHTIMGEQILSRIPFLKSSALIVRHHHERFDGSGYPDGLRGDQIPLGARLFSIIDTLDAITTDRSSRPASTWQHALREIVNNAGTQFDPRLVETFARIPLATWAELRQRVEQRRLPQSPTQPGAIPQLTRTKSDPTETIQ